ncbi:MAG: hypothetical protein GQ570_00390 [Helicobacteraceae bacterium]|nr:hypothetical protein [Helicobacteraceae bacterium]
MEKLKILDILFNFIKLFKIRRNKWDHIANHVDSMDIDKKYIISDDWSLAISKELQQIKTVKYNIDTIILNDIEIKVGNYPFSFAILPGTNFIPSKEIRFKLFEKLKQKLIYDGWDSSKNTTLPEYKITKSQFPRFDYVRYFDYEWNERFMEELKDPVFSDDNNVSVRLNGKKIYKLYLTPNSTFILRADTKTEKIFNQKYADYKLNTSP